MSSNESACTGGDVRYPEAMEIQEIYRGRLIDHVQLVVADLAASKKFYRAVFEVIGIPIGGEADDYFWADELFISSVDSPAAAGVTTGRTHLAFQASDRATVDRFHAAAVAAGGKDNGAPGKRPYHPGYYAAFVLDPDGNNIEVVHHGTANRSSDAVKITF
ncbi:VOC family protein [Sorangium sp. So ce128]